MSNTASAKTPFKEKTYRYLTSTETIAGFELKYKYSDIYIAIDSSYFDSKLPLLAEHVLIRIYHELESYQHPEWFTSLIPVSPHCRKTLCIPEIINIMSFASFSAHVGPMAGVAGAVAGMLANAILQEYRTSFLAVENGGDCVIFTAKKTMLSIGAGTSAFSSRLAVELFPGTWGVATSSGTIGHSLNFGRADACTIITGVPETLKDPWYEPGSYADAWATRCSNSITAPDDLEGSASLVAENPYIQAFFACIQDTMYYKGRFPLCPVSTDHALRRYSC